MIEVSVRLRCDECNQLCFPDYWSDDEISALLRTAEGDGWKVNRLARDVYYGKAWCRNCRKDINK